VKRIRFVLAGLALIVLAVPAATTAAVQLGGLDSTSYPTISASVVTSKPSAAPPLVSEDGRPVTALDATNLASGKSVVLAIDRSQSMKGKPLAEAVAAARAFVRAKPTTDRIAVTTFATKPTFLTGFSPAPLDASGPLDSIVVDPKQGTTLFDDVVLAAQRLAREPFAGRVIIMVTDGNETRSHATLEAAIASARAAHAAVYVVGIESSKFNPDPLNQLASQTGGRYFGTASSSGIAKVYTAIAQELARTWRVQYLTNARPGDRINLSASVVGEGSASQALTIRNARGITDQPPSSLVPTGAYGPFGPVGLAVAVAFLVLLAVLFFLAGMRGSWVRTRIAPYTGEAKGRKTSKHSRKERRSELMATVFGATERAFGHLKQWRWVGRTLERADVPLRTVEFFWIVVGCGVGMALIVTLLGASAAVFLVAVVTGVLLPFGWVWLKMRRRLRAFEDQLPDLLITIAASLKAGHSFKQGLQAVVDEGQPPASEELRRVLTEASLGRSMDDGLAEMAVRVGSKNFEFAITAVTIQREVGGSLATLFDMVADTVRQRQQFARKIRALTAMGRMSAYTLIGIPFFIAGTITLLNPRYMFPLYHTSVGHFLIIAMFVMMGIGSVVLKKIVSFRG
jgi:tight adherence protein B